ncbi:MAG: EamA family transporter [Pseudomonadota bacterium]|jgi:drug/metabolite transporter (DMT)-like permease
MWLILSLIAGLCDAVRDALSKRAADSIARPLITWSYSLCALPFVAPLMILRIPETIPWDFWALVTFVAACHVCGGLMLVKALHSSDLSVCTPMVAFTPVFLLVVGPAITGDIPSLAGTFGALLVVAGSYMLGIGTKNSAGITARGSSIAEDDTCEIRSHSSALISRILAPFRALYSEIGPRLMLALSLLWSITGSIDRIAVNRFDPVFWGSTQLCIMAIFFIPIVIKHGVVAKPPSIWDLRALLAIGGINCLSLATYLIALQLAPVHYVICIKRLSIPFSVLLGYRMFQENILADRLPGAIVMLIGVVIISLLG